MRLFPDEEKGIIKNICPHDDEQLDRFLLSSLQVTINNAFHTKGSIKAGRIITDTDKKKAAL